MLKVVLTCTTFAWSLGTIPADFPISHWEAYLDGQPYATVSPIIERQIEICVADDQPHQVSVVAVASDDTMSAMSDPSLSTVFPQPEHTIPLPEAVRSDLNDDGKVTLADFGIFSRNWGICNQDLKEVPCGQ